MSARKVIVEIPEESFIFVESSNDGKPSIILINDSLKDFRFKEVFSWNLSFYIFLEDYGDNGIPGSEEMGIIQHFSEELEHRFNKDMEKPNALFLFRETCDGLSLVTWRVYDSDEVEAVLQEVIKSGEHPREFEYRLEYDRDWHLVKWYLQDFENAPENCKQ